MKRMICVICLVLMGSLLFTLTAWADYKTDSVVKIFVTQNDIDYRQPWQSKGSEEASGSGCIIPGNRILTNAHVVNNATFIQVRKEADPKKYIAKVEAIGEDCDLAILTVSNTAFFKDIVLLEFGDLPNLQDSVAAIGYPMGGDKISITQGIVSRIEIVTYTQSGRMLLGVQIDAPINPGNSGGPIVKDGKLIGIAMQMISSSQNIGYMIPTPIINHFLKDLEDKHYDGFPYFGVDLTNTENRALKKYYSLEENGGGALITHVYPFSAAEGVLEDGDIIQEVDGIPIADDKTFEFRKNERLALTYLINDKQVGDDLILKILRQGKIISLAVKLKPGFQLVPTSNYFKTPPYYIYGGFIFSVLSIDLIKEFQNDRAWGRQAPLFFRQYVEGAERLNEKKNKEIVILLRVLPDEINIGYQQYENEVITQVNGKDFTSFKEFVNLLRDDNAEYIILQTEDKQKIIILNQDVNKVTQKILERNNITQQFSEDVALWLKK